MREDVTNSSEFVRICEESMAATRQGKLAQGVEGDDVSACVTVGSTCQRDRRKEKGEIRAGVAGLQMGWSWTSLLGWLGRLRPYFFLSKHFLLFLFSVFKTEFRTSPKTFYFSESLSNIEYYGTSLAIK